MPPERFKLVRPGPGILDEFGPITVRRILGRTGTNFVLRDVIIVGVSFMG